MDDDERTSPRFGRRNFEKILDDDERTKRAKGKTMKFLEEMLEKQYGKEITKTIIEGYKTERKTTLRVNTIKSNIETIKKELKEKKSNMKKFHGIKKH